MVLYSFMVMLFYCYIAICFYFYVFISIYIKRVLHIYTNIAKALNAENQKNTYIVLNSKKNTLLLLRFCFKLKIF